MTNNVNKSFLKNSHFIIDLKLCSVRSIDNCKFPWIILIPNRKNITDITELKSIDQTLLMKEIVHCSKLMKKTFKTSRLNIEKIGNVVPQLHIHIIARFKTDSSWPLSVWVVKSKLYSKSLLKKILINMNKFFIQR